MGQAGDKPSSEAITTAAGSYRWWLVGMLWLVCLFNYADRQAIFSVFERLKEEMNLADWQLGIIGSSFMWVYAVALPLAGLVGDFVSRKFLILGGLTFWSIITILTGWSSQYEHLVLFRALEGLGEAFYMPASLALISEYHGPDTRSRAMGLHQSSVYAGTVVGGSVAGWYADHQGWRYGFYLFGWAGVVLAAVLLLFLREPPRRKAMAHETAGASSFGTSAEDLRIPMVLLLTAVFVGANFVAMIFLTWLPSYLNRRFALSLTLSGLNATFWLQAASFSGALLGGWLADRWTKRRRGGRMLVQAVGLLAGAPLIFLTGWTEALAILIVALVGFGIFKGMYDANIWAALYDFVPRRWRATAMGFMNSLGWFGGAGAPLLFALAAERFGMGTALSVTSLIYVLVGSLLLLGLARAAATNPLARKEGKP
jgi:MFS family permease